MRKKWAATICACVFIAAFAAACSSKEYTVTFDANGGYGSVPFQTVVSGGTASEPETEPVKKGYRFTGWYTDKECEESDLYDFHTRVEGDLTLYAGWQATFKRIATAEEFAAMEADGEYMLGADLDFTGIDFCAIGSADEPFSGVLDGDGHKLSNITTKDGGVFGVVTGTLRNLTVESVSVDVSGSTGTVYAGGLAGFLKGGSAVNCTVTGSLKVVNADAKLSVYAGGVSGRVRAGEISGCTFDGTIRAENEATVYAGGIVGYVGNEGEAASSVRASVHCGIVESKAKSLEGASYLGGIAGYNAGNVSECFSADGTLTGVTFHYNNYAGGIAGDNNGGTVRNCVSASDILIQTWQGNTFSGAVTGRDFLHAEVENCYGWDGQTVTLDVTDGAYYLLGRHNRLRFPTVSAAELSSGQWQTSVFRGALESEDGFLPRTANGAKVTADLSAAEGTAGDPIEVKDAGALSGMDLNKSYRLTADIALSGDWTPVGGYEKPFYGTLDGNGHTISGIVLTADANGYGGLFGYFAGVVKNLKLEAASDLTLAGGKTAVVGTVAGINAGGIVEHCEARLDLKVKADGVVAGGIVGRNDGGIVTRCSASGSADVTAENPSSILGGVCGVNDGSLTQSFSAVSLLLTAKNQAFLGGIAGKNGGSVADCYNIGSMRAVLADDKAASEAAVGGITGQNGSGEMRNVYNRGTVACGAASALKHLGGLCGINRSVIDNGYYLAADGLYSSGFSPVETKAEAFSEKDAAVLAKKLDASATVWKTGQDGFPVLVWQEA